MTVLLNTIKWEPMTLVVFTCSFSFLQSKHDHYEKWVWVTTSVLTNEKKPGREMLDTMGEWDSTESHTYLGKIFLVMLTLGLK